MQSVPQRSAAQAVQLLIIECVKRDDSVLNELAAEALVAIGPDVVSTLVAEIGTSSSPRHRVQLLRVVEAIGEIRDPGDRLALLRLAKADRAPQVRAAAKRTFMAVGPNGPVITVAAREVPHEQPRPPDGHGSHALEVPPDKLGCIEGFCPLPVPVPEAPSPSQPAKNHQEAPAAS